jgi:aspartyl-tRNA(Asn)/glutamyl-tRNA(Gln) amidotransferase subunit A
VRQRIERGREMSAVDYIRLLGARAAFIRRVEASTAEVDALILPTVTCVAPPIAAFAEDAAFWRLNARLLRNANIVNFLDRCAVSLPVERRGEAPVGLMVVGSHGGDRRLLAIARALEAALEPARAG